METEYKYICECGDCSYKSNHLGNFKNHQSNKHDYSREWNLCKECNLRFTNYQALISHTSKYHASPEELQRRKNLRSARNKRYRDSH